MELPQSLKNVVQEGRAVLFLGAGATYGSTLPGGKHPPLGNALGDLIAERFLDGGPSTHPLAWTAELAISATSAPHLRLHQTIQ